MSKELKFRAWNNKDKLWAGGSEVYLRLDGKSMAEIICDKLAVCGINSNDYVVIEQYTGLNDKNGKEIYEGDIIDYNSDGHAIGYVKYNAPHYELIDKDGFTMFLKGSPHQTIIGNIHENPGLLEGE